MKIKKIKIKKGKEKNGIKPYIKAAYIDIVPTIVAPFMLYFQDIFHGL